MAPELVRARKDVDGRADQYALAATVYEVLMGRPPFVASESQAVMVAQVSGPCSSPKRVSSTVTLRPCYAA
jgi:serine/threonine protein kinase